MTRSRRRPRWPWVVLFGGIAAVALFYVGGAWYFSTAVYADALKSEPYDPGNLQGGVVQSFDPTGQDASVTILPDPEFRDETKFDNAVMGIVVGESLLVVGPAVKADDGSQTRPVIDVVGGAPRVGDRYGLTRDVWLSPEMAGLKPEYIQITTPDDLDFPAWQITKKRSDKWAILVHGKGASRSETLRMSRALTEADYNLLVITHTGDIGAPAYPNGMVQYGRSEWREVEAAVRYVRDEGAETIILGGISHGGAVVLGFMQRGTQARRIDGLILDSPASSLADVIDEAAEHRGIPPFNLPIPESLEDAAKIAVSFRYGVDFSAVDYAGKEDLVTVPVLTFQGSEDRTVPPAVNDRFMATVGKKGTYVVVDGADHVLAWNTDPPAYEKKMKKFLKKFDDD